MTPGYKNRNGWLADRPQRHYGSLDAAKVHVRGEEEHPWRDLFEPFTEHHRAQEAACKAVTYFTHNRQRTDYPSYRAKGYQIGSGTIESGCKQIVTQRLKVPGAVWDPHNAIKTAKARAALLRGQWDTLSSRREHISLPLAA